MNNNKLLIVKECECALVFMTPSVDSWVGALSVSVFAQLQFSSVVLSYLLHCEDTPTCHMHVIM